MRGIKSNTRLTEAQATLTPAAKRRRVQIALDNFCAGRAGDDDFVVFRDPHLMVTATAEHACSFLEAAPGRSVPIDVVVIWADVLRQRYKMSMSGRRSGTIVSGRSKSVLSRELVKVPASRSVAEEGGER